MAVYVDTPRYKYGRMIMCHMLADSLEELHAMADRIGVKRKHFQLLSVPHYDICKKMHGLAIGAGAIPINMRCVVQLIKQWRIKEAA